MKNLTLLNWVINLIAAIINLIVVLFGSPWLINYLFVVVNSVFALNAFLLWREE